MNAQSNQLDTVRSVFEARRTRLMDAAGDDAVLVIPSATMLVRNSDVEHDFRQNSDFYYLTGFDEPDAIAVLRPGHETPFVLFVRPRDKKAETWTGRRAGVEGAKNRYGADEAFKIDELDAKLPALLEGRERLGYTWGSNAALDKSVVGAARLHRTKPRIARVGPDITFDTEAILHETRLRKSEIELGILRRSAAITVEGHHEAMRLARPGAWEYELQAGLEYVFAAMGATRVGYSSIVAAGDNATILHYNTNRMTIGDDDLILIDAGAELNYYTTDVTRTFPANGRFTPAQRDVYEVVLAAQLASIQACVPGRPYKDSHDVSVRVLTEGMVSLGLLEGDIDELITKETYKRYYMHRTGHWLGMDVHDVGAYNVAGGPRAYEPGMVTTIEPGLYIPADDEDVPEALRGIGVRIEDDVLITETGHENLTAGCVKTVEEVEAMVSADPRWVRPVSG